MSRLLWPLLLLAVLLPVIVVAEIASIVEVPAVTAGDTVAFFFSGDGGWRKIDQDISARLSSGGIHVAGINSMRYFWKKRTPEETAKDLERLINSYSGKTGKRRVLLIGYSFGADILPPVINRLPVETRKLVTGAVLLGVSDNAMFEVSAKEWLGKIKGEYPTLPEIARIDDIPLLIIAGTEDDHTVVQRIDGKKHDIFFVEGDHHFGRDYHRVADIIMHWYKKNGRK